MDGEGLIELRLALFNGVVFVVVIDVNELKDGMAEQEAAF